MMLADEGLFIAEVVEPFDQLHIALEAERRVFTDAMEGGHENSKLHHFLLARAGLKWRPWATGCMRLRRNQNVKQETATDALNDRSARLTDRKLCGLLIQ